MNFANISSDTGLSPLRHQAIIWNNSSWPGVTYMRPEKQLSFP